VQGGLQGGQIGAPGLAGVGPGVGHHVLALNGKGGGQTTHRVIDK